MYDNKCMQDVRNLLSTRDDISTMYVVPCVPKLATVVVAKLVSGDVLPAVSVQMLSDGECVEQSDCSDLHTCCKVF